MTLSFQVNQQINIDNVTYRVAEHPAAPGMPYGQEGRQAIVYQLFASSSVLTGEGTGGGTRALKVFKPRYRVPALVSLADRLFAFADLPGLAVCRRVVLTPQKHGALLRQYPDLTYSVLMPWIEGPTWMEVLLEKRALTSEQCLMLAHALAETLTQMEQRELAHCDLSGPNILLPALAQSPNTDPSSIVALVDVEQLYAPGLEKPAVLPAGSSGYAHKTASEGLWSANADRFAGAVLIAEMLGWCDERVRAAAGGESYFDPNEIQQDTDRYQILRTVLRERWGERIAGIFNRAWQSETQTHCATFGEVLVTLPASRGAITFASETTAALGVTQTIIAQARQLEQQGDLRGASDTYHKAIARLPEQDQLRDELAIIATQLENQLQAAAEIQRVIHQAEQFEREGKWQQATDAWRASIAQSPNSPSVEHWRAALKHCEEEAELARLFDNGAAALQRGERATARELLGAVMRRRPAYARNGTRAAALLERTNELPQRSRAGMLPLLLGMGVIAVAVISIGALILMRLVILPPDSPTLANSALTVTPIVSARTLASSSPTPPPADRPTLTRVIALPTPTPRLGEERVIGNAPMLFVPAGDFLMGSAETDGDANSDEKPQHTVSLDAFWIDKYQVTNALYKKCVDAGRCAAPQTSSSGIGSYFGNARYDNYPVVLISWFDAKAFCEWSGKRLPTEAEWEKAARGTDARLYPWGNRWEPARLNFCDRNCRFADFRDASADDRYADLAPVGSFPSGVSPYNALDMAGNASEWVSDWYDENYYRISPRSNPSGPVAGQYRDVRGGAWDTARPAVRAANRERTAAPNERNESIGFRCVVSAPR